MSVLQQKISATLDILRRADETNGAACGVEDRPTTGENPALDAGVAADDSIFRLDNSIAFGIERLHHLFLQGRAIFRVNAGEKNVVIDMRVRRQAPPCLEPRPPVERAGRRVPFVGLEPRDLDGALQHPLAAFQFGLSLRALVEPEKTRQLSIAIPRRD